MIALAIDLGGSHADCAVVGDGFILAQRTLPVQGGATLEALLPLLRSTLLDLISSTQAAASSLAGLVLGFCGIVDARERRVLAVNGKYEDAVHLDLNAWCRDELGLPFFLENDARLALLGEYAFGAGRGAEDVVMVTLGSGVGGAALLQGHLLQSRHGLAGMIGGHLPVVLNGRLCLCGNRGCADAEASTASLGETYARQPGSSAGSLARRQGFGFAELFEAADAGDRAAQAALEYCLQIWSALTVALIHAYDPEVVVFGGAVLKRADAILPRLSEYVHAHAWTPGRSVAIRAAVLGSHAALLGAIPLIESNQ